MSSTRLLVLGVVRFAQPVHGYEVRRELLSWHLEDVTNVKPGSIYSALRTLARNGLLEVAEETAEAVGNLGSHPTRPERTAYRITPEGEKEFMVLLRRSWWTAAQAIQPLIPALTMMPALSREELTAALESRIEQLRTRERQWEFMSVGIHDGDTGADGSIPDHVRELVGFLRGQAKAEIDWALGLRQRIKSGSYRLAADPPSQGAEPQNRLTET